MPSEIDNKTEPSKEFGKRNWFFTSDLFKLIEGISSYSAINQNHLEDYLLLRSSKDQETVALSSTPANM